MSTCAIFTRSSGRSTAGGSSLKPDRPCAIRGEEFTLLTTVGNWNFIPEGWGGFLKRSGSHE